MANKEVANKEIVALTDFEHVLARPTMYIGSLAKSDERVPLIRDGQIIVENKELSVGFYKMMIEILDNAFDEAKRQQGETKKIEISFNSKDNSIVVIDSGGGFINASAINKKTGVSNVESAMTMLRAGSNFFNESSSDHLIGTNGVGASIVNMLSDKFEIETINDKEYYFQSWEKFQSSGPSIRKKKQSEKTGTRIKFTPRKDTFKGCEWDKEYIHTMMIFKQFLKKDDPVISKLNFTVRFDEEVLDLDVNFIPDEHFQAKSKIGTIYVWESFPKSASVSFMNGAMCSGIHQRIIGDWLCDQFKTPSAYRFYETFIVLNMVPKLVQFGDQNKTRFVTSKGEILPHLQRNFHSTIRRKLKHSPIYEKIMKTIDEQERASNLRKIRNQKRSQKNKISDKYFPPSGKTENLFIVEGGSAMGSILQKRDPKVDAVYALKGKIRNARRLSDLTSNSEILDLMNILNLDPENDKACKYDKVIIATDADPDGLGHIASLITNLFHKWFPTVIQQGKLFILQTPLLSAKDTRMVRYFYSMSDFEKYNTPGRLQNIRYLKGLGSLSREDWEYVFADMHLLNLAQDSTSNRMMEMAFGRNASLRKKWLQS